MTDTTTDTSDARNVSVDVTLRELGPRDLAAVLALGRAAYAPLAYWPEQTVAQDLGAGRSIGAIDGEGVLVALVRATDIAGVWHVLDVASHPSRRRDGLASLVLGELLTRLRPIDDHGCTLEVRRSNTAAIGLYARHGFRPAGERRRYYSAPVEDAVVMWRAPSAVIDAGCADGWEPQL